MSRNLRTSTTDPIQIPTLSAASGRIGISFCPGKQGPALAGFTWNRDLATDLDAVRGWGAAAVVSLIEKHEMGLLGVADLEAAVAARGMEWLHLPIPVKRRSKGTPDRRRRGTPFSDNMMLVC